MHDHTHVPNGRPDGLHRTLRQAVDCVRQEPVPQAAMQRALSQAARLGMPMPGQGKPRRPLLALAALAAAIVVGVAIWPDQSTDEFPKVSLATRQLQHSARNGNALAATEGEFEKMLAEEDAKFGPRPGDPVGVESARDNPTDGIPAPPAPPAPFPPRGGQGRRVTLNVRGVLDFDGSITGQPGGFTGSRGRDQSRSGEGRRSGRDQGRRVYEEHLYERSLREPSLTPINGKEIREGQGQTWTGRPVYKKVMVRERVPYTICKSVTECTNAPTGGKKKKEINKEVTVWRVRQEQPTFARVYVGGGNSLDLVSIHVSVTVEGARARTVVDHIFRNPHDRRLEGTFEYPLPAGASPSYFAMFLGNTRDTTPPRFGPRGELPPLPEEVLARMKPEELVKQVSTADWGKLQVARLVSREKAVEAYEEVVRGQIDPALLEYAAGNTFRGRVFPIPPKGYNRVLLAYEELLPVAGDRALYRFPLPNSKLHEMQFSLEADRAECADPAFLPKDAKQTDAGKRLVYRRSWKDAKPEGEVRFAFAPARGPVQYSSGRPDGKGPVYLYARVRPELKSVENQAFARHAVFMLDTSLSEHPDRFAVNLKLLGKILESDNSIEHFNVLTFNTGSAWVEPKGWLANTPAGRKQALDRLNGVLLEGATDLSAALDRLANPGFKGAAGTPVNVFLLSDGQITWGEADVPTLAARFEGRSQMACRFHCYRTGLGAENLELFEALARKGGGIFNCFTPADLPAAAKAHRQQCLQVEKVSLDGGPAASDLLVAGRRAAVYPGGELIVAARLAGPGTIRLVVEGTFLGRKVVQVYQLDAKGDGELAPRGWAEIAVGSLLALNDPKLDRLAAAYCQQFGIASRVASFLVLETEADYKRFDLDRERKEMVPDDLARFLEAAWKNLARAVPAREAFDRFLAQIEPRVKLMGGANGAHVKHLLALLGDADFELPEAPLAGALVSEKAVPKEYLAARARDRRDLDVYLAEARRRLAGHDVDGAIRVLSSVVEEFPGRGDALRLVGYRLLDLGQAAHAVRLFQQVQRQRPFEPHSYRDLARSLEESGRYGLAAVQYEILLAGTWHQRFHQSLKDVAQEEYARMMQDAIRRKAVGRKLADHFGSRLERMSSPQPRSDLRVTISWNTDATDVDLWVIEPDGTKCFYQHNRTKNGGELSQDQTQGYGPERYQVKKAMPGEYTIVVHYFRPNPNLLAGETHVNVTVARNAGSPEERVERHTVVLKKHNQEVMVCKVKFSEKD